MKKILSAVLALIMVFCLAACNGGTPANGDGNVNGDNSANADFKIGVILVGDETEGYTLAHMDGIKAAAKTLGLNDDQIIWEYKVPEDATCKDKADELALKGCKVIFANSYGHQDFMQQAAEANPDVTFVSMTGDYAGLSGVDNLKNAFTRVYESRYVSGIVAGLKIKELVDAGVLTEKNFDSDGNVKIGYVGAYPYAEVKSGFTAFFLGIQSVYEKVAMEVTYTNSWFDIEMEGAAAEKLMADGCVIIGQHADSTGAPAAVEAALKNGTVAYSIGYNIDMLDVAPTAALTSASNNWSVYYTEAIGAAMKGEEIPTNWSEGYETGAVNITALGESCAEGTEEAVNTAIAAIKDGTLKVFDTSKFTVNGEHLTEAMVDLSYMDFSANPPAVVYEGETVNAIKTEGDVSYFAESDFRSAPYFALDIDGIGEKFN